MRHITFIFFLQVVQVKSLEEVSGYLGDTVTLLSGGDPSWNLSKIEWSIFSNNTWIATYRNGKEIIERVPRYNGRLRLNTSSGDLTIHNLTARDEMDYTVDLVNTAHVDRVNKIKLRVRQRLQEPTIKQVVSTSVTGGCVMVLNCSSADNNVSFSWHVEPHGVDTAPSSSPDGSSGRLLAFINTTQNYVKFTCTCSRKMDIASRVMTSKCDDDDKPQPTPEPAPSTRNRNVLSCFIGGFLGGAITALLIKCFGEKLCPKASVV